MGVCSLPFYSKIYILVLVPPQFIISFLVFCFLFFLQQRRILLCYLAVLDIEVVACISMWCGILRELPDWNFRVPIENLESGSVFSLGCPTVCWLPFGVSWHALSALGLRIER